jgi:hypothetical protein
MRKIEVRDCNVEVIAVDGVGSVCVCMRTEIPVHPPCVTGGPVMPEVYHLCTLAYIEASCFYLGLPCIFSLDMPSFSTQKFSARQFFEFGEMSGFFYFSLFLKALIYLNDTKTRKDLFTAL